MIEVFGQMSFYYIIFLWLGCAAYCAHIAKAKELNYGLWALGGLFFGIVALVAVSASPPVGQSTCPHCCLGVSNKAKACPHCTREINPVK
ncbi:MAG TPA: hypothetical protein VHP63_00165 [candidate division Zixibacteria bacterium]|nr:hypothetical protein [candidate division Zixibacteria bacterium]